MLWKPTRGHLEDPMTPWLRAWWPVVAAALLAATAPVTTAASSNSPIRYEADSPHSHMGFTAKYMGVVDVRGSFSDVRGTLLYVPSDPTRSTVSVVLAANSLDTGNKQRDQDLRGVDFFDVVRFPKLRFTSTRVEKRGDGFAVSGDLTIRNVTKSVILTVESIHAPMTDPLGVTRIGWVGRTRVNRLDFGVVGSKFWNNEFAPGRFAIGDSVEIELTLEAKVDDLERRKPEPSRRRPLIDSVAAVAKAQGAAAAGKSLRSARDTGGYDVSASALMLLAGRLLQRGDAASAVEVLKQASELYANSADVHAKLAEAYWLAGQREGAIQASTRAIAIDPYHTSARETLRWARGD